RNGERAVGVELAAGAITENRVQVETRLRVAVVHIVTGQQAMPLRSHIADLQNQVFGQLALDVQVVLGRILRPQVRLKLSIQQNGAVKRPVHWLSSGRIENSVKWIGLLCAVLLLVWRVEQRSVDDVAAAERRLGAELLQNQLLHRVVEETPT